MTNRKTRPRKIDEHITLIVTALAVIPTESCSRPQVECSGFTASSAVPVLVRPRGLSSLFPRYLATTTKTCHLSGHSRPSLSS